MLRHRPRLARCGYECFGVVIAPSSAERVVNIEYKVSWTVAPAAAAGPVLVSETPRRWPGLPTNGVWCSSRTGGAATDAGGDAPAAVVCHPHPMYGGSMYNNVVDAILAAMWQAGYATLRFNFRGVGASEGEHDGGPGEVDDAVAAMTYLLAQPGVRKEGAVMAGYSFGAMVAVSAGYERAEIARIVAVALPLAMAEARIPDGASKPILMVSGDRDSYSPVAGLRPTRAASLRLRKIPSPASRIEPSFFSSRTTSTFSSSSASSVFAWALAAVPAPLT